MCIDQNTNGTLKRGDSSQSASRASAHGDTEDAPREIPQIESVTPDPNPLLESVTTDPHTVPGDSSEIPSSGHSHDGVVVEGGVQGDWGDCTDGVVVVNVLSSKGGAGDGGAETDLKRRSIFAEESGTTEGLGEEEEEEVLRGVMESLISQVEVISAVVNCLREEEATGKEEEEAEEEDAADREVLQVLTGLLSESSLAIRQKISNVKSPGVPVYWKLLFT